MSTDGDQRARFLIALAKFFGESPKQTKPLATVQVCADWHLFEIVNPILKDFPKVRLTLESFNQLMLNCGRRMATPHFFTYFFSSVASIDDFEAAVDNFRRRAMWLYGNFKFAYRKLAESDQFVFERRIRRTEPRSDSEYTARDLFTEIDELGDKELVFLGYVSSGDVKDLDVAVETVRLLLADWGGRSEFLARLGPEMVRKIAKVLKPDGVGFDAELKDADWEPLAALLPKLELRLAPLKARMLAAQEIGEKNTHRYLTLPYLDVYVATSMRYDEDFVSQHAFVRGLFSHEHVRNLKLRYFDPTLSYTPDRVTKGLIEGLMLRRARVTVYHAGAQDTMGKDSELAATLAQGKPAIVFVPPGDFQMVDGRKVDLNSRATTFRENHPLGLQICATTGVAHGIIVVRSIEDCARMLRSVLLHQLELRIVHEGGNFRLEETSTKSVLRVVTDDALLTHSFWTYFRHNEPEVDI
jgi:hypothetical protein